MTIPQWLKSVHHDGSQQYVSQLMPQLNDTVRLRLRVAPDAPVRRIYCRIFPDGEQAIVPMVEAETNTAVSWWTCEVTINQPHFHYRFIVDADDGVWHYSAMGVTDYVPLDNTDFKILADYYAPTWLKTAVFYQIFPDRFANGDPRNDPQPDEFEYRGHHPQTYAWGRDPDPDQPFPIRFYGGDLQGITQNLDYLEELGINGIYLNPIFTAHSNHKYDVIDYDNVDTHFGGNEALISLSDELKKRNMRYLLDIVPNHCGYWHPWFLEAREDANAETAEFFTFSNHPEKYASWLGVWMLPKLNYRSEKLRQRMYDAPDSVFRKWLSPPFAADGWRVDVANMLGRQGEIQIGTEIAEGIRRAVKESNPEAYLMGENFFDGTAALQGTEWDGIMNYGGLATPLFFWLTGYEQGAHGFEGVIKNRHPWRTTALAHSWQSRYAAVPWVIALQQFNNLGSHDIPRLRTILGENDALHKLALIIQFTFPGIPCIYYGDEIGMVDDQYLGQRGCMIWDEAEWNGDLLSFYKTLIKLRRETAVLQTGGFQILAVEENTIAYQRANETDCVLVIAHRDETARVKISLSVKQAGIADGTQFIEYFTQQKIMAQNGELPLPQLHQGTTVWQQM